MFLFEWCCKFLVVGGVLRIPTEEGMHTAGLGPHLIRLPNFGFFAFPKDVHAVRLRVVGVDMAQLYAGIWRGFCIVNGAEVSVNGKLVFAEGRHYGAVRAASWSFVSLVV